MNLQENLFYNAQFTYFKSIIKEKMNLFINTFCFFFLIFNKFKKVVTIIKVAKPKFKLWHMQKNMNQYNYLVKLYLVKKKKYKIK